MEFTVNIDRAFELLTIRTGKDGRTLKNLLIEKLQAAAIMQEREDCGKTVAQLAAQHVQDMEVLAAWVLGQNDNNTPELLGNITILASDQDNPCPECGCSLQVDNQEHDGFCWEDLTCSNTDCSYKNTTEPDWDMLPGGHGYDR